MSPRRSRQTDRQKRHAERSAEFWAAKRAAAKTPEDLARVIFDETRARIDDHRLPEVRDRAWIALEQHAREGYELVAQILNRRVDDSA